MKVLAWSSAADSRWTKPIHQTCDTRNHLLFDSGQNYLQLKQNTCHRPSTANHHPHYAMLSGPLQKTDHGTNMQWYECAPINWRTYSGAITYQHGSYWQCNDDTYRFLEGDETAGNSYGRAGHGTGTRPSPSFKKNKRDGNTSTMQAKYPQGKTLPHDYLLRLCGQFFWGMTQWRAIPQQCLQPRWLALALTSRLWWWLCAKLDEKPSSLDFPPLLNGSPKIQSVRTRQGSQKQTKQFAGGNASTAADRMWSAERAVPGTHFQIGCKSLCKHMRTSMKRQHSSIGTSSI